MTIKYFFFNKDCIIDRALANHDALENILREKKIDFSAINFVNQIHSNQVLVISDAAKIHGKQNLPKADAIVTNVAQLAIAIFTADCGAILLRDEKAKIIAAVHAGWRGAQSGIIKNAILEMQKLGSNVADIRAVIGPMIHQKSYQISQEFYDNFIAENSDNKKFFKNDDQHQGRYLFDLLAYIMQKLQQAGVQNIENTNIDTYPEDSTFFSYRRATHQGIADCGRNISLIVIN